MQITLTTRGDERVLVMLGRWLSEDEVFRGRVHRRLASPAQGTMGAVLDAIVVEAGLAVSVLVTQLVGWLRRQSGPVEIEATSPDGVTIKIRAREVRGLDAEGIRALSDTLATRLTGYPTQETAANAGALGSLTTSNGGGIRIFISYVREDTVLVAPLVSALTDHGFDPWWDQGRNLTGQIWKSTIRRVIQSCDYFIACFSPRCTTKLQSFMNEELITAVERRRLMPRDSRWLIPVILAPCDIPNHFIGAGETMASDLHYLDFSADWDDALRQLVEVLRAPHS